ncbi:MAG TPA: excinuclease ABC subunit UvrB, partial [Candidatus Marinimicrobia bacterium]|nr:excinuclease ABC subunit UvrB [Candidatus Neomarinimicrobiota bacterium]
SDINQEIEKLRLKATTSLIGRRDVIVIASVSCIYGLGSPENYKDQIIVLNKGETIDREKLFRHLVKIHYTRNDMSFSRSTFRVRGDTIEIYPAYDDQPIQIEMWGDTIESISMIHSLTGDILKVLDYAVIYPARHFITNEEQQKLAVQTIRAELSERLNELRSCGKLLEAQRLEQRTEYDLEMIQELGYCSGIENYSRHFAGRAPGSQPFTLMDFFPDDSLIIIDESHATIPQVRAMYNGDRSRKSVLIEFGFRLPSAFDNRPLKFEEFEKQLRQTVFVSATPANYELEKTNGVVVEQILRPTGLLDPEIVLRPTKHQIDNLMEEIRQRVAKHERVLVTTLTKKMAENLADYLKNAGIQSQYMHSEIDSLERITILRDLRLGKYDVLVGINLLREGLDLPEVSLVAILDADKEGFLRSERSLFQIAGRAARNSNGRVIFYADRVTDSMQKVIDETNRRREAQKQYNDTHGITPTTIYKSEEDVRQSTMVADVGYQEDSATDDRYSTKKRLTPKNKIETLNMIDTLTLEMEQAASKLEFELAARLRDEILILKKRI